MTIENDIQKPETAAWPGPLDPLVGRSFRLLFGCLGMLCHSWSSAMHQFHQFAGGCDDHLLIFVGPYFSGVFDLIGIANRRFIVIKCLVVFLSLPPVEVSAQQIDIIGQHLFVDAGFSSLICQLENDAIGNFVEFLPAIAMNGKPVANHKTSEERQKIDGNC